MKNFRASLIVPLLLLVAGFSSAQESATETDSKAALEKARELFPEFQKTMLTDPEAAKAAFAPFLEMPDAMQKRLQIWLDAQWVEKRRDYERSLGGSGGLGGSGLSPDQKQKIREDRETLETIKGMGDEDEMKKELKSKGWPALNSLLTTAMQSGGNPSPANPHKTARLLEESLTVGNFRYQIRVNRDETAVKPHEELGIANPDAEATEEEISAARSMEMARKNQSVLQKNEDMKGEIPSGEYDGILEVNQWRIAAGLNALLIDPKLCEAARDHSKDMANLNFFAHDSPVEGKKAPWDRARNFGTTANAENIAINSSPAASNLAWFYSPGHHKNMFAANRSYIGLGIHGRHYTQLFR